MFKKLMVAVDVDEGRGAFVKCLGGLKDFGAAEAVVAATTWRGRRPSRYGGYRPHKG